MEDIACLIVLIWECLFLQESVGMEIQHSDVFVASSLASTDELTLNHFASLFESCMK